MAVLRSCSVCRCLTFPDEVFNSLGSFLPEWPSRSTRRWLTGASSRSSSSRAVKSQV